MKTIYCSMVAFFIFFGVVLCSCGDKRTAMKLYNQREFIQKEFKDKSIIKRVDTFFQLSYYKGHAVNTFFFEKKSGELELTHDTLQYPISEIAFVSTTDTLISGYSKTLRNELSRFLNEMNRLGISNISAQFASVGVDMKIYFGDYKALLYISDLSKVKNERWRSYIDKGEKLDANWYYVKDEQ